MLKLIPIFSFFLLFTCCEREIVPTTSVENPPIALEKDSIDRITVDVLIFKKEKKVELWERKTNNELLFIKDLELMNEKRLLLGIFVSTSGKMELKLPGTSYQNKIKVYSNPLDHDLLDFSARTLPIIDIISAKEKTKTPDLFSNYHLDQVIVFPNDARSSGKFDPCINCPHWMVEIYGSLEWYIKNYPTANS